MLTSSNEIAQVYLVRSGPAGSNEWRAVIRIGQDGDTLRNSASVGGSQMTTSLVPRIGTLPRRPRIANLVPTPIGLSFAVHERTAGSIKCADSGDITTANTVSIGLCNNVVSSTRFTGTLCPAEDG